MRAIAWLLPLLTLGGCAFFETIFAGFADVTFEERTVVLQPVMIGGDASLSERSDGTCDVPFVELPLISLAHPEREEWLARGGADAGIVPVSYANQVWPGAQPLPCDRWQFPVLQGKVTFDLSPIPDRAVVERAALAFEARETATRSRGFLENTRDCRTASGEDFAEIGVGPAPVGGSVTSLGPLPSTQRVSLRQPAGAAARRPTVVTALVANMLRRDLDEQQFIISPKDTVARQLHDQSDFGLTRYCALHLSEFELTVDYLEAVPN